MFTNRFADDYTLRVGTRNSPCIDVGNTPDLPQDVADLDWDCHIEEQLPEDLGGQLLGNDRVMRCGVVDMGAYEAQVMCPEE